MSGMAIMVMGAFAAAAAWCIGIGIKACLTDMPPFMQGEGQIGRYDNRMDKAA